MISTVAFAVLSDFLRRRGLIMAIAIGFGFFSFLFLAVWEIPIGLKWFAYFCKKAAIAFGPLALTWANEICSADAEERALVLGLMNSGGYSFSAWLPLFTYPARSAPRFKTGFIFSTCASGVLIGSIGLVSLLWRWELRKERRIPDGGVESGADVLEES